MLYFVEIPDKLTEMMESGLRVRGSLGMVNKDRLDFHMHAPSSRSNSRYIRLRHGRASVNNERVRLTVTIDRDEHVSLPTALYADTGEGINFIVSQVNRPEDDRIGK